MYKESFFLKRKTPFLFSKSSPVSYLHSLFTVHIHNNIIRCSISNKKILYPKKRYQDKVSGPLLDRIDIHVEVAPVEYNELSDNNEGEKSSDIKKRVDKARAVQQKRFAGTGITCNAKMTPKMTKECCVLSEEADELLHESFDNFSMSARAYDKVLRLARTIADLADSEEIKLEHIAEALQFRALDRKYWEV